MTVLPWFWWEFYHCLDHRCGALATEQTGCRGSKRHPGRHRRRVGAEVVEWIDSLYGGDCISTARQGTAQPQRQGATLSGWYKMIAATRLRS